MNEKVTWPDDNKAIRFIREHQADGCGMTAIRNVEVIHVIAIEGIVGSGVAGDPVEDRCQFWTLDGQFIGTARTRGGSL